MSGLSQDEFLGNGRTVLQGLEALQDEHVAILKGLSSNSTNAPEDAQLLAEKRSIIDKNLERIAFGIEEAEVMMSLSEHLHTLEAEEEKRKALMRLLREENDWLRDELNRTQNKCQVAELRVIELEEEMKHFQFMDSLKQYDDDQPGAARTPKKEDSLLLKSHDDSLQELGFGPEEDEVSGQYSSPTPAHHMAASATGGYEVPATLRTLHNLVIQYASQGRYEVAVPLCKQALEDLEKNSGHDHPDVATMLNLLAIIYKDQSKYKEAANLLNEALNIREKCLGENHPAVAATLNNLAVLYGNRGKYKEAEPLCKRALEIREKALGNDHPDVAKQMDNLAVLYGKLGKCKEAVPLCKRALEIRKKLKPTTVPVTLSQTAMDESMH